MKNIDYARGALSAINEQLLTLEKKKRQLTEELEAFQKKPEGSGEWEQSSVIGEHPYAEYLSMMRRQREPVENPRVVFQGEPGAYSEMACRKVFGKDVNAVGLHGFQDTFLAMAEGRADYAVLPIENSSTGAIRQVYDLLESYSYFFVGETTVQIEHALLAVPGAKIENIKTVYSHEQGLFQCEQFLSEHPHMHPVSQADTAGSARMVAELQDPERAAIGSKLAAEIYGLEILKEQINTQTDNTTRFVVISPKPELRPGRDKICISLTTGHRSGALLDVLMVFTLHNVNLVRLESRPVPDRNWKYMFFIEFTGNLSDPNIDAMIHEIALMTTDLRILGNFKDRHTAEPL